MPRRPVAAECLARDFTDAGQRTDHRACLERHQDDLLVVRRCDLPKGLDIFLRDEIIDRLYVALRDGIRHHARRVRLRFGQALARFGVAESGFPLALGLEDLALLFALRAQDLRLPAALRLQDLRALVALGLHLPAHRLHEVGRRGDVLDLDAGHLDAPGIGGLVHHAQQLVIDLVALRQHLVEVHRTKHRPDIGHGEVQDRVLQPLHLIGRPRSIQHLVEGDAIGADRGIVTGDDFLRRHVEHLLHHAHLDADRGR